MGVLDLFRLDGKIALVTGASKGIGQAIAVALAEAGADVACLDYLSCEATEAGIQRAGRRALSISCDLGKAQVSDLAGVVEQVIQHFGALHILVNNAGITRPNPALQFNEKDYDDEAQINQKALFFLSQATARQMAAAGGGKIVNVASLNAFVGGTYASSYTGTKSAVAGFTHAFAVEWARLGIHVNAIAPGFVKTDNTENMWSDTAFYQRITESIPARRWATPQDFAGIAVFLASQASDYLHGTVIPVDGGKLVE